jgi:hypothetical protein
MGDLNNLMHASEKLGPTSADINRINKFCSYVKQCGFIDLGYNGPAYTWTNKRFSSVPTYERLDRCLGNAEWCKVFPATTIYHLPMMYSDHAPILAVLNSTRPRTNKPFRFENWWLMEHDFQNIAQQSWQRSSTRDFSYKTKFLAADLKKWRRKKPKNNVLLVQIENQILEQQNLHPSRQNHSLQQHLHDQHQSLLAKEEAFHVQRIKKSWVVKGDRNTAFFHNAIIKRHRKNKITSFQNPDGSYSTTPQQLATSLTNYFTDTFSTSNTSQPTLHSHRLSDPPMPQNTLPTESNAHINTHNQVHNSQRQQLEDLHQPARFRYTYSTPNLEVIHGIIKKMRSNTAPGPDGLNAAFYKAS